MPYNEPDPVQFPTNIPLIAPYWADADTRPDNGGTVWYRETTSQADRNRVKSEIRTIFTDADQFVPSLVFIATWDHVGYFPRGTDLVYTSAIL